MRYKLPSRKILAGSLLALIVVATAVWWFSPLRTGKANAAGSSLPYSAVAQGPYTVRGNKILDVSGQPYIFHGIGRDGLEYNCSGEGPLDQQHLAYMGTGTNGNGATYWGANTIRLPLSEGFWLYGAIGYPCTAAQYQALVKQTVDALTALNLNVIIDLQWSDAAGQSGQGGGPWAMPDADSVTFWQQVATIYKGYSNVLFELFNEPHTTQWSCWASPCQITNDNVYSNDCKCFKTVSYASVGMQALVNAVRNSSATNLVLVAGLNWGFDLSQITVYPITGSNVVYDTHPYPYAGKLPNTWDSAFGNISATYPVISAESGEYDCQSTYLSQLYPYFDAHQIGWVGWAWAVQNNICGYPQLTTDYQGTPSGSMGQFIYQQLHSYVPQTSEPVNSTWYFAEGRVGGSFKELLTLDNPDSANACNVSIEYLYVPDHGSGGTKTVQVTVNPATRLTESVNNDLGIQTPSSTPADTVSAVVTVTNGSVCKGIVAERPMYFNIFGVSSGTDVLGSTHLGTSFNFADIPTGNGFTSFISILSPPSNSGAATITVNYYANGQSAGLPQTLIVQPGTRGTISPEKNLPPDVAAVVTSTQPVLVERPTYFSNTTHNTGSAGSVSGATDVVGVQAPANDWLFAEGYTGNGINQLYQENLIIANTNTATANVTVNLEYQGGGGNRYPVTVGPKSVVIWNVNANSHSPNGAVSAEVTSTGASILVQRQIFFRYSQISAVGGTDVLGQVGPAAQSAYSFAEGYTNAGYNEWLTLQNPTTNAEVIWYTLINAKGRVYSGTVLVAANSRGTVNITAVVQAHLVGPNPNSQDYAVSMTVQTVNNGGVFVAERPFYFNANSPGMSVPVVGGSDILGYTGG